MLLEVSADPRDGTDFVQTNPINATSLELVAVNDNVRLRGMTIHFTDGRTFSRDMHTIRAGERVRVELPENSGTIQSVNLDYGRQVVDRTTARLQIIPRNETRFARRHIEPSYYAAPPTVYPPQPVYQPRPVYHPRPVYTPRPATYVVRPQSGWSASIQGTFRF